MDDINDALDTGDAVYKTLLESTQAIPWRIDWASSQFTYIGPQIENLLGWEPSSWVSVQDWAARMHPEDRRWAVDFCVAQSIAGVDHEADYRALTRDGGYVWIRDVVHVVRNDDGSVNSLIGFMFDISERKRNEQQLIELQHELERLSFKDGLTGVGNRRHFETTLATEWNNAQREHKPLSLILLDIDFFKQYNDHYGHVAGDDCLRRIGALLEPSAARPRDLVARYGGEEFVLVLPGTDAAAAMHLAERCRASVADAAIAHARSAIAAVLTVSLGVGTVIPAQGDASRTFIEAVDRALYQAKQQGRNRVVASAGSAPVGAPDAA